MPHPEGHAEFSAEKNGDEIVVHVPLKKNRDWRQKVLLMTDLHFDSTQCNRDLLYSHIRQAKREGAIILMAGDIFDVMCSRHDPRRSRQSLRPEYSNPKRSYFQLIVEDFCKFFGSYAGNIAMISPGNHENSCLKNNDINLITWVVDKLNAQKENNIVEGLYEGMIRFAFEPPKIKTTGKVLQFSKNIVYSHGYGGGGQVTDGAIDFDRMMGRNERADILWMGHTHHCNYFVKCSTDYTTKGRRYEREVHCIRSPGYKMTRHPDFDTWESQMGMKPKPMGAWYVNFGWTPSGGGAIEFDIVKTRTNHISYDKYNLVK